MTDRSLLERQLGPLAFRQIAYEHDPGFRPLLKGAAESQVGRAAERGSKRHDDLRPVVPASVLTATDVGPISPPTVIPGDRKQEPIEPGYLSVLGPRRPGLDAASARGPGPRGAGWQLARWLTRPDNPPIDPGRHVNRAGLIPFRAGPWPARRAGLAAWAKAPSLPELLDWLAAEFVAGGWQEASLHRLILTSAAYQAVQCESDLASGQRIDPENRLSLRTIQRLGTEEIRDAALLATPA